MYKRKNGISLIVLVITILVMIILAGVVVVTMQENNPIEKAQQAKKVTSIAEVRSAVSAYAATVIAGAEPGVTLESLKDPTDTTGVLIGDKMYYTLSSSIDSKLGVSTKSPINGDKANDSGYYAINAGGGVVFVVTNKVAAKELGLDVEKYPSLNKTLAGEGIYLDI